LLKENTLLIDADIRTPHVGFHFSDGIYKNTLHDVLQNKKGHAQAVHFESTGLKVVPGDPLAPTQGLNLHKFKHYKQAADYVIFDAPSNNHDDVLDYADQVIIVTEPHVPALMEAKKSIEDARKKNKILAGVVLNKLDTFKLSREQVEMFLGLTVVTKLPNDPKVFKSLSEQEPFIVRYPNRPISKELQDLAARLANKPQNARR